MNKSLLFFGLSIQILQLIVIGIFWLSTLNLTIDFVIKLIGVGILAIVNIISIILMIVGALK